MRARCRVRYVVGSVDIIDIHTYAKRLESLQGGRGGRRGEGERWWGRGDEREYPEPRVWMKF